MLRQAFVHKGVIGPEQIQNAAVFTQDTFDKKVRFGEERFAEFDIHPMPKHKRITVTCRAPLIDRRFVTDSGGHREKRYVIKTPILVNDKIYNIEITLADRETMVFRMLIGRQAMHKAGIIVAPGKSHVLGKYDDDKVLELYEDYFNIKNGTGLR